MYFLKIFSKIPLSLLYRLSDGLYFIIYRVIGYRKKIVFENLRQSFPNKTEVEIKVIAKKFYRRFCDFGVETIKAISISKKEIRERVHLVNPEFLDSPIKNGSSLVFMASHQFNWEWGALCTATHMDIPLDPVYQKLSNKQFNDFMIQTRSRFGGTPIEKDATVKNVVKNRNKRRALALVADQTPPMHLKNIYWTNFLNRDTPFYMGVETISKLGNMPVYFMQISSPRRGYYEINFKELGLPPYQKDSIKVLDAYIKATEEQIIKDPSGWLWTHKRWKHKRST